MKRYITILLLVMAALFGQAQTIAPALLKEMGQRGDDEKIRVFVIMKQQYDQTLLNSRAEHFATRAERRDFVVNELKQFAEVTQSDLRHTLYEMERNAMVSEPKVLWIANALYFEATQQAIYDLASRTDIELIGYDQEVDLTPVKESPLLPDKAARDITPNVTQVGADQVWNLGYTGQGVVVAVVDGGVNYNHLDLTSHLWDGGLAFPHHGYDIGENDNDPMDTQGHGTHCAGTVCGDGGAGRKTGMAPDVTLMCVKITSGGGTSSTALICDGIQWATEHGCDIFSLSWGGQPSVANKTLYRNTCVNVLAAGVIGSIAAGNLGANLDNSPIPENVNFPAGCPPPYMDPVQQGNPGGLSCSVCVGAVDYNDEAASFTSVGPVTWSNTSFGDYPYSAGSSTQFGLIRPDVSAPGVDIVSAHYAGNSGYLVRNGTSMATPCVAGCMALMLSKNPELTPADICRILEETAVSNEPGKNNITGYGRVDVLAAVNAVPANVLSLSSYYIHDEQGNNDHQLNAGEAVTMDMGLVCGDNALNNATLHITTTSDLVTITNGTLSLPDFAPGQSQTVSGFAFTMSNDAPIRRKMTFYADVSVGGSSIGHFAFTLAVIGSNLVYEESTISSDNNGNGLFEAGETANLHIVINNIGNETAPSVIGTLSSSSPYLTINNNTVSLGDLVVYEPINADFSITLSANASNAFPIPFTLHLVYGGGQTKDLEFSLYNITTTSSPQGAGILTGTGTYGDGASVRITAVADDSHTLINWKAGNTVVSYTDFDAVVSDNVDYVAYFNSINDVVPIGQAVASNAILPTYSYYNYVLTEQIYTVQELGEAHDISSVAFFNAGTAKTRNCRIFMKYTDKSVFQSASDWVAATPDDLLFEGEINFTKGEWKTIYFNRAFVYDGIHNVVLIIDDNTGTYSSGLSCRVFEDAAHMSIYVCGDHTNFDPYNPFVNTGYYPSEDTYRNQVLFGIASYDYNVTVSADPSDGGMVSAQEGPFYYGQSVTVTATPSGNNVFYYWSENGERVSSDATYNFTITANRNLVAHFGLPVAISVVANPEEGGTVEGACSIGIGQPCSVSATTNPGFLFDSWAVESTPVSYISDYNFYVEGVTTLVANFEPLPENSIAVGQATTDNITLPTYSYYKYSLSEQIYTADEIGRPCNITSIAFFNTTYEKTRNLSVYLVVTDKQKFTGAKDWISPNNSNRVFAGNVNFAVNEWTTIMLDTPFAYNGTSNLVLVIDDNTGTWDNNHMACRVYDANDTQTLRIYSDDTNFNPLSPSNYSGTRLSVKNQIVLGIEGPDNVDGWVSLPVTVFPNPAVDELHVMGEGIRKVEVHNILGQHIETVSVEDAEIAIINMENYEAGIYVLTIHTLDGVTTQRLVKQNK